ncbi:carbohydrate ABC transporter permease [Shumkonia mesophila]|uniref:carbohydrate ABC transporter permease n=1 Tax=Shumkonia mesophila TaxID=2838854 RepID=UPI0029351C5C|nr:sugar ABC transporter permease [Shumkonia mesophila]
MTIPQQRRIFLLFFLLPGMAYLVIVRIVPAFFTFFLSFTRWDLTERSGPEFIGLRNYIEILHDQPFLYSVGRTLFFTVAATGIELVLGFLIALFVHRDFLGKNAVRASILTPMVITPAIVGVIWYVLFHSRIGPLNWFLTLLGLPTVEWLNDPNVALLSLIITDVWHWTPFMFLLCLSAMQMIPEELYESAEVDGASRGQMLVHITLPMIRDTLVVAVILRSMEAFEIFAEPFVMTGGGPGDATETLSLHIYKAAFLFFEMGYAGAMVVISIAILVSVYSFYWRFIKFD